MAIDSTNPIYDKVAPQWQRIADVLAGNDAVKAANEKYLPRLSGQSDKEYSNYKTRALFFDGSKRALQGYIGLMFKKSVITDYEDTDNIGIDGENLHSFTKKVAEDVIAYGRAGVLMDINTGSDSPYLTKYPPLSIINWRAENINGNRELTLVVLREVYSDISKDGYEVKEKVRFRVLHLKDNVYYQEVFVDKNVNGISELILDDVVYPTVRGKNFNFIPFLFINPNGLGVEIEDAPLLPLVDVNLSHYRTSADIEHGRHFTALPTPWVAGFPADTVLKIGSSTAWVSSDSSATAGFLEYTGQGLNALKEALEEKQQMLVVLGARILDKQKTAVEAKGTHLIRKSGEDNVVASIAVALDSAFSTLLSWLNYWKTGADKTFNVTINKDYNPNKLAGKELKELVAGWIAGAYSFDTLFYNLKQGEIMPYQTDIETERQLIINDIELREPTYEVED